MTDTGPTKAAPTDAEYEALVERGKYVISEMSRTQWWLGDLAAEVEKNYGENRLEQFAEDINFDGVYTTLERYRTICQAFPKSRGRPRYFASAQVLVPHPGRFEIVEGNPTISEREARAIMRKWRDEQDGADPKPDPNPDPNPDPDPNPNPDPNPDPKPNPKAAKANGTQRQANRVQKPEALKNIEGWYRETVIAAINAVINELNETMEKCEPEQRKQLAALDPYLLLDASQNLEKKAAEFADWVDTPLVQAADALEKKSSRVVVTKRARRASKPIQSEA